MNDESIIPNQQKRVPYQIGIYIEIKGNAPEPKDKEKNGTKPYLPISFIEYIQTLAATYERNYRDDGLFIVVNLSIRDIEK